MRQIEISTDVFSRIWSLRIENEENEDAILRRILSANDPLDEAPKQPRPELPDSRQPFYERGPRTWSQPTWATDLAEVLLALGGKAHLSRIYRDVEAMRQEAGRSVPSSLEATVRRTLENHSSDSRNYTGGADLFYMPEGKGSGIWALRK